MAQMAREFSAGGVVVRQKDGQWLVAAIQPTGREAPAKKTGKNRKPATKPVLTLPKGLIDPGERPEQTAVREIREETGIEAERVTRLGNVKYVYVRSWGDGARVFKVVTYYLFLYLSGRIGNIKPEMHKEVEQACWISLDDAAKLLTYKGDREMARAALDYIKKSPDFGA